MKTVVPLHLGNPGPLELLAACGGYYECPKDAGGKRQGPLVGYAGTYADDGSKKAYVGEVYVNFAKAERQGAVLRHLVSELIHELIAGPQATFKDLKALDTGFCGAPEGGKALAAQLAAQLGMQYIYPEKEVIAVKTAVSREKSKLVFSRHEPERGDRWWIVEDVANNFSTRNDLCDLLDCYGARAVGIICFLNRSPDVDFVFTTRHGRELPVVALVRKPMPQFRQNDPAVAEDVASGNVVWKPKNDWDRLEEAVQKARSPAPA